MTERTPRVDCVSALKELWDFLDGELTPDRLEAIRQHIDICSSCFPHYDFEKTFLEAIAATRPGCSAPDRLKARVEAALREAGYSGRCAR
ncbi:MAG TPA: zf-HC2 domain-containing protein [Gemmatimonadaceae bacterium]|nr:zf-HC2 domain-containing protein [Gemmatimonadaceae bacterium]